RRTAGRAATGPAARPLFRGSLLAEGFVRAPAGPPSWRRPPPRLSPVTPPDRTALYAAIRASWGPDTAYDPAAWSPHCPERGQCAVTALIIQDHLGGDLLRAVAGGDSHYWNLLPSGEELDLTRAQFASFAPEGTAVRSRGQVLSFPSAAARYAILAERVRHSREAESPARDVRSLTAQVSRPGGRGLQAEGALFSHCVLHTVLARP